ncbi:putative oligopeptide transport system ATP-binding protein [Candidatus Vecturithrix granuli]|uniref:Putative oligopeptide transport system ATP-binding protein n=1 Tax=Vecturithrix granuli TaxID=1499967 RepID=A0A081BVR1_VECG1|nr:putative oligopeptide transport system ATP-binding protein [Candidatus Vecturithrix granuli]
MSDILLQIKELQVTFFSKLGPLRAVDGISYAIRQGKTLGLVGESGCGKSVTSYAIMGLLDHPGQVTHGSIRFDGQDLTLCTEQELQNIRGNRISMIFQEPMTALNPVFTIGFQLDEQILRHKKVSKTEARNRSIEMLRVVGIPAPEKRYESYPHQLSGGMRQRAMIAMALSCDPEFLIADEPTTAIDVTIQAQILDLMQSLQERFHMAIQFITHDLGVVSEVSDDVVVMYAGKICEIADADTIFNHPKHPYTYGLIESIPKRRQRVAKLYSIPGTVVSLIEIPEGCRFQNRCPNVLDQCRKISPELTSVGDGHSVACFNMM